MNVTSLQQRAYQFIQKKIITGELTAGSQISEHSLAKAIGISRTPVRDAITQLQSEGYVERVPRYGTIIRTPDRHEIAELFEVREALESYAAGLAAERITGADLRYLRQMCDELLACTEYFRDSGQIELDFDTQQRFLVADMAFHMRLIQAAGNRRILKIVSDSHIMTRLFSSMVTGHTLAIVKDAFDYHERIVQALEINDADSAGTIMAQHIRTSQKVRLEQWDQMKRIIQTGTPIVGEAAESFIERLTHLEQLQHENSDSRFQLEHDRCLNT